MTTAWIFYCSWLFAHAKVTHCVIFACFLADNKDSGVNLFRLFGFDFGNEHFNALRTAHLDDLGGCSRIRDKIIYPVRGNER